MDILKKYYDPNKIINSRCYGCGKRFFFSEGKISILFPCEHFIHKRCAKHMVNDRCAMCKEKVVMSIDEDDIISMMQRNSRKKKPICYQYYVDIMSLKPIKSVQNPYASHFFARINNVFGTLYDAYKHIDSEETFLKLNAELMATCNLKIKLVGSNNLSKKKKVVISNHTSYLDAFIMIHLYGANFVRADNSDSKAFDKILRNVQHKFMKVSRGAKPGGATQRIKEHIDKYGDMCIFPEGWIKNPNVLTRFRTGAFHCGYPVQPVVITYEPFVYHDNILTWFYSVISQNHIYATVKVLPLEEGPFDDERIEQIRVKMARVGNLALTRTSNKDVSDNDDNAEREAKKQ